MHNTHTPTCENNAHDCSPVQNIGMHHIRWLHRDEPQTEWRTADLTRSFEEVPGNAMFTT
eukprot:scaffold97913_cov66-Phaeocystis_antarctica.AAC.4